ncbi:MAG TPA: heme ABC transporter permease [Aestuariivirgaceae bacterium]|jgi:heme exporter protein C|nr:heme ABC transporter permease [Aestuariivirgaceae bacterium]
MMQSFANPTRFLRLANRLIPWAAGATAVLMALGLYLALIRAPQDYQQGETVRIMFVHVPAAWMALMVYSFMALAHGTAIVFRHPLADLAAKAAAPAGSCFTFLALATGSLWGRPMWGTWWQWGDARLTSMFVLFLLYIGYLAVWQAVSDPIRAGRIAAVVAIVGFINVPIVKFSVDWWSTLHQPASVFRMGGPTIHPSLLVPLGVMAAAYAMFFLALWLAAMKAEIIERRIQQMQIAEASRA